MSHVLLLMSNISKKVYSKMCAKHPSFLPLGLPSHRYLDLLPLFYFVLAQIQFTEWTLLFLSHVQIHINIAQSNSKEMPAHPYRETCVLTLEGL